VIREAIAVTRVITNAPMALDPIRLTLHMSRKTINDFSASVFSRPRAKSRQANDRPGADPGHIRWDQTHGENWCRKTLCLDCRQMLASTCVRTKADRDSYSKTWCYDEDLTFGKETRPTPSSLRVQFLERSDPDRRRQGRPSCWL
jgi:hypothetical protein